MQGQTEYQKNWKIQKTASLKCFEFLEFSVDSVDNLVKSCLRNVRFSAHQVILREVVGHQCDYSLLDILVVLFDKS